MFFIIMLRPLKEGIEKKNIGYFKHKSKAIKVLREHRGDPFEDGYYKYGVVIYIPEGIYRDKREIAWYEYTKYPLLAREISHPKNIDKIF